MKDVEEIRKSIRLLIKYPRTFNYLDFCDRGNSCTGRLDIMTETENADYAEAYAAVLKAMPKYSELHLQFAPILAKGLGIHQFPRYDFMIKILARLLGDDKQMKSSDTVLSICLYVSRIQKYMKDTGKSKITAKDLAYIGNLDISNL